MLTCLCLDYPTVCTVVVTPTAASKVNIAAGATQAGIGACLRQVNNELEFKARANKSEVNFHFFAFGILSVIVRSFLQRYEFV